MHTSVAASTTCSPPPRRQVRRESCAKHFLRGCTETVGMLAALGVVFACTAFVGRCKTPNVGRINTIVRLETRIRRNDATENFGVFVYVLDGFPQLDFVLWVFMCPTNISLLCVYSVSILFLFCVSSSLFSVYHAEGYHAPYLPPRAITPVYSSRLSHQNYHAPQYTYIGLSHPLLVIRIL